MQRGRILFARRNNQGVFKYLSVLYMYLIAMPKTGISYLMRGRLDLFKAILKALWWNVKHSSKEEKST
jgi:hypothetical protein